MEALANENVKNGRNNSESSYHSEQQQSIRNNDTQMMGQHFTRGAQTASSLNQVSISDALSTINNSSLFATNLQAQRLSLLANSLGGPLPPLLSTSGQMVIQNNPFIAPEIYSAQVQARQAMILNILGIAPPAPPTPSTPTPLSTTTTTTTAALLGANGFSGMASLNPTLMNNSLLMLASQATAAPPPVSSSRLVPSQAPVNAPATPVSYITDMDVEKTRRDSVSEQREQQQSMATTMASTSSKAEDNQEARNKLSVPQFQSLEDRLKGLLTEEGVSESFPSKLHRLLLDLESLPGGSDIACFLPEGNSFIIIDPIRFESEVMRKYFPRMGSFASFQRQLNIYDFNRISKGTNKGAYYHQCFVKSYPLLSRSMKRRGKGSGKRSGNA